MSMNAAVLHGIDDLSLTRIPAPEPGPDEVLLKVEANIVCSTDLRIVSDVRTTGVHPRVILGHELAGRVAAVDESAEGVDIGVQATCSVVLLCGRCLQCLAGREHLCENLRLFGYKIDSGFAEYLLVPREVMEHGNLVLTPREFEPTTLTLARPVGYCPNRIRQPRVNPGEAIVVLGTGSIRLLHTVLAGLAGAARIVAVGRPGRFDPVLALGTARALASQGEKLTREILDVADGGTDVAIVTAGDPALANQALEVTAIGGRINYFAGFPKGSTAVMEPNIVRYRELRVTSGSNARRADVHRAVELLSSGALDVGSLVTHRFPLTRIDAAIAAVRERVGLKVAVVPD